MNKHEDIIEGEVIHEETTDKIKPKRDFKPLAKKALLVGGAVVGMIVGIALLAKDVAEEAEDSEEDADWPRIETVDNLDGTESLIVTAPKDPETV